MPLFVHLKMCGQVFGLSALIFSNDNISGENTVSFGVYARSYEIW